MSQQNQGATFLSQADLPMKRKRGRPRKDESVYQGKNSPVIPVSGIAMSNKPHIGVSPIHINNDSMVGQVVSGVVEGSFDAGYLLTVRVGNTETLLRGVVFQPGRFIPISKGNDVAPHARMFKRRSLPIPLLNQQPQVNHSIPQSEQKNVQPIQFGNRTHVIPSHVDTTSALGKQSASNAVHSNNNMPKNDSSLSLGRNVVPQQTFEPEIPSPRGLFPKLTSEPSFAFDKQTSPVSVSLTGDSSNNHSGFSLAKNVSQQDLGPERPSSQCLSSKFPPNSSFPLVKQSAPDFSENDSGLSLGENVFTQHALGSELPPASGLSPKLSSEPSFAFDKQSVAATVSLIDNLQKNEPDLSLGKDVTLEVLGPELPPGPSFVPGKQSAPLVVSLTDYWTKNDSGLSSRENDIIQQTLEPELPSALGLHTSWKSDTSLALRKQFPNDGIALSLSENVMPQRNLESRLENHPPSQLAHDGIVQQEKVLDSSTPIEGPKVEVEESKDLKLDFVSEPIVDTSLHNKTVNPVTQTQHQTFDFGLKPNELAQGELKSLKIELHQNSGVAEPKSEPHEQIDVTMKKQDSSKDDILQDMQLDLPEKF